MGTRCNELHIWNRQWAERKLLKASIKSVQIEYHTKQKDNKSQTSVLSVKSASNKSKYKRSKTREKFLRNSKSREGKKNLNLNLDSSTSKKDRLLKSSVLFGNPLSNFPQTTPQTQKEKNTGVEIEQEFHSVLIQSPSLNNAKTLEIKNSIHTNTIESVNITQKSKKSNQTRRNKIQTEDGFTNTHLGSRRTREVMFDLLRNRAKKRR